MSNPFSDAVSFITKTAETAYTYFAADDDGKSDKTDEAKNTTTDSYSNAEDYSRFGGVYGRDNWVGKL